MTSSINHVGFCFIPIYYSVVILFLTTRLFSEPLSFARVLSKSLSASSSTSSHGRMSPIFVSAHNCCSCLSWSPPMNSRFLFASPCVRMAPLRYRQHLLPPHDTFLLCFTSCALNMRHCFHWEGISRCHVLSPFSFAKFTSWARTHADPVQLFPAWK